MFRLVVRLALLLSLLAAATPPRVSAVGCAAGPTSDESRLSLAQQALRGVVRELPLETKLGQLLMPGFVGTAPDAGLMERVTHGRLGGLFLLGRNVRSLEQIQDLTAQISAAAEAGTDGIRPFLAVDFEGGTVNALRAITGSTASAAVLAGRGADGVEAQAAADAETLRYLGFNINLAPVADVLTESSDVIGTRAFSSDPHAVSDLSRGYLRGLRAGGVLGVMKHFPGHGATAGDSHVLLPTVNRSRAELEAIDLVPYRDGIASGELEAVMAGHLFVPSLDPELPVTLSSAALHRLLREDLGFDGLLITDELKMRAISGTFNVQQAAVMAVRAGADVILGDYTGAEQESVIEALSRACSDGTLPLARIDESVARILRLKLAYGLAGSRLSAQYASSLASLTHQSRAAESEGVSEAPHPLSSLGGTAIAGGRFYTDASPRSGHGYAITDVDGMPFWSTFASLGGPMALGFPISQRFTLNGMPSQLTQRALLQWHAEDQSVRVANVFELFGDRLEPWLRQKGIPPISGQSTVTSATAGATPTFDDAVRAHLRLLQNDAITAAFLEGIVASNPQPAVPADGAGSESDAPETIPWPAIERYGLPRSAPQQMGPFIAQRFQRVTFQLWVEDVPGMPPAGTVTQVLGGDLFRDAGLVPQTALIPVTPGGTPATQPDTTAASPGTPATQPAALPTPISPLPTPMSPQPTPTRSAR